MTRSAVPPRARRARAVAIVALVLWGLLHLVGGTVEAVTALTDGGTAAIEVLAADAAEGEIPRESGRVVESVVAFHGFLIAAGGVAVLVGALFVTRVRWPRELGALLAVVVVADVGLLAFLVVPGFTPIDEAMGGVVLGAVAVVASAIGR